MRGINFQSLLKNWDTIVHKLCEEASTHDVLQIVYQHVQLMEKDFKSRKINAEKIEQASKLIEQALKLLDPEG